MVITPAQCRGARGLLNWTQRELAEKSGVNKRTIVTFENEKRTPYDRTLADLVKAFEEAGVVFVPEIGGKLQATAALKHGVVPKKLSVIEGEQRDDDVQSEEGAEMRKFFNENPAVWARLSEEGRDALANGMGGDLFGGTAE